jgi:hypothetical protein
MKIVVAMILVIAAVLAGGCISSAPSSPPTAIQPVAYQTLTTPHGPINLLGNWSGPARGYTEGAGYRDSGSWNGTMVVTEQRDPFFSGYLVIPYKNGTVRKEGFSGVITPDGNTFRLVEYDLREHADGWIRSDNEIQMVWMMEEEPQSIMVDYFQRMP